MQSEQPALVTFMNDSRFGITSDNGSIQCNLTIMARPGMSERETVNQMLHHLFNSIREAVDESPLHILPVEENVLNNTI